MAGVQKSILTVLPPVQSDVDLQGWVKGMTLKRLKKSRLKQNR